MTIDYISKAKAESLSSIVPQIVAKAMLAPDDARFLLLADEKMLSTYFVIAIVVEKEILWISDQSYQKDIEKFLMGQNDTE